MKNNDFPGSLGAGITLIGRNNYIPGGAFIGSACYVAEGTAESYFSRKNRLEDGESVITSDPAEEKNS
jgi:hypothetical protein